MPSSDAQKLTLTVDDAHRVSGLFHVPARTGRKDADVRSEMLDALAAWIDTVIAQ